MSGYIVKRLLLMFFTLFLILVTNFVIIQMAPGGPVEQAIEQTKHFKGLGSSASSSGSEVSTATAVGQSIYQGSAGLPQEKIEQIKKQYGFDQPAHERFWLMLTGYLTLDFGTSFFKDKPVTTLIKETIPVSLYLGIITTLLMYLISIPLGINKALKHGSRFDYTTGILLALGSALPVVSLGVILLITFAGGSYFQWFPLQGFQSDNYDQLGFFAQIKDHLWHLTLPLLTILPSAFAGLTILTKFSFMEEIHKQYVYMAKSKGIQPTRVLYGHVFRNSMLVVIAGLPASLIAVFFTGNLLIENIFNLNGLGRLSFEAIQQRDYPIVFGTLFIFSLIGLVLSLISDLMYMLIDPRIDLSKGASS